jgi:uncharacterized membrane protein YidH (DUF202 family)
MGESHVSTDTVDENARKQFHEGIEMTLMGWIRTSITLIGFGFALGEAFSIVRTGKPGSLVDTPREYLINTVAFGLLGAVIQCRRSLKRFKQGYVTMYERPWHLSLLVAALLMIIGLVALVAMTLP